MEFLSIVPSKFRPHQDRDAEADWSFLDNTARFVLQLLAVPLFNLIVTIALGGSLFSPMRNSPPPLGETILVFALLLPILLASCVAYGICTLRPYWFATARFVWLVPAAFFSYGFLQDVNDYALQTAFRDFFGPELLILMTLPTASCCAYSFAAFLAHRHHAKLTS